MSPSKNQATVFVVDDDPETRKALRLLLTSSGRTVESFATAEEFLDAYDERPGCLVLDVRMPRMSGLELQEQLAFRRVEIPVIFVTAYGDVPSAVRAMREGAVDFLEKPFSGNQLLSDVGRAIELDERRRQSAAQRAAAAARLESLTPREREVVRGLVRGLNSKRIAGELGITAKTVDNHRTRAMAKLGLESIVAVVQLVTHAEANRDDLDGP
jgi:FixJ family two-component response regulator